jgi:hypothetical protein
MPASTSGTGHDASPPEALDRSSVAPLDSHPSETNISAQIQRVWIMEISPFAEP